MFNLLLALIAGLVIGWNFHAFFMQLSPQNILKNDINSNQKEKKSVPISIIHKSVIRKLPQKVETVQKETKTHNEQLSTLENNDTIKSDTFNSLLQDNLFSDAMSLYIDANEAKLLFYQSILIEYFETEVTNNPQKALEEMLEFQEIEPSERRVDMEALNEIEDNNYQEKSQILLNLIKEEMERNNEYTHEIPLKKLGEHFAVEVNINYQSVTLLLDTGATLTLVDKNRVDSTLNTIKENIVLSTAGGEISAKLKEAEHFSLGDVELEKFQLVVTNFKQNGADGLLGMNFFKKFKFKIDQEEAILYLSELEK